MVSGRFALFPWSETSMGNRPWGELSSAGRNVHGRTVNGATSPDTPQRRNSIVKHVFRNDKSSFAGERRLSPSFGCLHGPVMTNSVSWEDILGFTD